MSNITLLLLLLPITVTLYGMNTPYAQSLKKKLHHINEELAIHIWVEPKKSPHLAPQFQSAPHIIKDIDYDEKDLKIAIQEHRTMLAQQKANIEHELDRLANQMHD